MQWGDRPDLIEEEEVRLNLTPLVDVVFSLLVVFMVSSAALYEKESIPQQLDLELPSGALTDAKETGAALTLQLDGDGNLFRDGMATDRADLQKLIGTKLSEKEEVQVRVEADRGLAYQRVMDFISELHRMGVRSIGLATKKKKPAP